MEIKRQEGLALITVKPGYWRKLHFPTGLLKREHVDSSHLTWLSCCLIFPEEDKLFTQLCEAVSLKKQKTFLYNNLVPGRF